MVHDTQTTVYHSNNEQSKVFGGFFLQKNLQVLFSIFHFIYFYFAYLFNMFLVVTKVIHYFIGGTQIISYYVYCYFELASSRGRFHCSLVCSEKTAECKH